MKHKRRSSRKILGISPVGFNTSCTLLVDGKVVFAVEEERLTREKRTRSFPVQGIREALKTASLRLQDLDAIAVSWNPAINLEAFNLAQSQRPRYLGELFYSVPNYLMALKEGNFAAAAEQTLHFLDEAQVRVHYVTHHLAHAAAFFVSPYEEAAIMTVDAFGEKDCVTFNKGKANKIQSLWSQEFPHSLGSFYSAITEYLGFQAQSDEWKLMGASSYGDSNRFYPKLRSLIHWKNDDGFELDLTHFNHYQFHRPSRYTPKLIQHLGIPPNRRDQPLNAEQYDLAAAAQRVTEEVYFRLLQQLHARTRSKNLVLAGGVAFNSVANGKILEQTPFRQVFIPPVPDDAGGSLGAAYHCHHQIFGQPRCHILRSNYFGPGFSNEEIRSLLRKFKINYSTHKDIARTAAKLVASDKIIGWFQGRLEFGDRALGNRSILADPRDASMKDRVNETVKYREPFRPFAPSILTEHINDYFENAVPTPFMEKVFMIREEKRKLIPAVTHVDGTGRLQTVDRKQNPLYWQLIDEFRKITGLPLVLNTSFNLKGEPMVCSPQDAVRTFFSSGLDALVMGDCLLQKGHC